MSMVAAKTHRASYSPDGPATRRPNTQEHDLPLLAFDENAPVQLDWEFLLAEGVQPALILGAERRGQGGR